MRSNDWCKQLINFLTEGNNIHSLDGIQQAIKTQIKEIDLRNETLKIISLFGIGKADPSLVVPLADELSDKFYLSGYEREADVLHLVSLDQKAQLLNFYSLVDEDQQTEILGIGIVSCLEAAQLADDIDEVECRQFYYHALKYFVAKDKDLVCEEISQLILSLTQEAQKTKRKVTQKIARMLVHLGHVIADIDMEIAYHSYHSSLHLLSQDYYDPGLGSKEIVQEEKNIDQMNFSTNWGRYFNHNYYAPHLFELFESLGFIQNERGYPYLSRLAFELALHYFDQCDFADLRNSYYHERVFHIASALGTLYEQLSMPVKAIDMHRRAVKIGQELLEISGAEFLPIYGPPLDRFINICKKHLCIHEFLSVLATGIKACQAYDPNVPQFLQKLDEIANAEKEYIQSLPNDVQILFDLQSIDANLSEPDAEPILLRPLRENGLADADEIFHAWELLRNETEYIPLIIPGLTCQTSLNIYQQYTGLQQQFEFVVNSFRYKDEFALEREVSFAVAYSTDINAKIYSVPVSSESTKSLVVLNKGLQDMLTFLGFLICVHMVPDSKKGFVFTENVKHIGYYSYQLRKAIDSFINGQEISFDIPPDSVPDPTRFGIVKLSLENFILGHEYSHLLHKDQEDSSSDFDASLTPKERIAICWMREYTADRTALDIMATSAMGIDKENIVLRSLDNRFWYESKYLALAILSCLTVLHFQSVWLRRLTNIPSNHSDLHPPVWLRLAEVTNVFSNQFAAVSNEANDYLLGLNQQVVNFISYYFNQLSLLAFYKTYSTSNIIERRFQDMVFSQVFSVDWQPRTPKSVIEDLKRLKGAIEGDEEIEDHLLLIYLRGLRDQYDSDPLNKEESLRVIQNCIDIIETNIIAHSFHGDSLNRRE
jgi:hypothetical protein